MAAGPGARPETGFSCAFLGIICTVVYDLSWPHVLVNESLFGSYFMVYVRLHGVWLDGLDISGTGGSQSGVSQWLLVTPCIYTDDIPKAH